MNNTLLPEQKNQWIHLQKQFASFFITTHFCQETKVQIKMGNASWKMVFLNYQNLGFTTEMIFLFPSLQYLLL